jgi:hypothetical protein
VFLGDGRVEDEKERDGAIHHEKLGLREFRVRVNLPSPIWQVRVPIRRVITPIRGLPNPIRQVVPLISHIRSYPPHCSHFHPPSLSFSFTTQPSSQKHKVESSVSISPCHDHELTSNIAYIVYNINQVQHTPSTAYTEYSIHRRQHPPRIVCLLFILMITSSLLNVASSSRMPPYTFDCHQLAPHVSSQVKSPSHIPTFASPQTDEESLSARHTIHRPALSTRPISLDHSLRCASPISLNHGPHVHFQTRLITASKYTSKLTRLRPSSASPNSLN